MHTPPGMNADGMPDAENAAKAQEAEEQKAADNAAYEAENQGEDKAKAQEALQDEKQEAEEKKAAAAYEANQK